MADDKGASSSTFSANPEDKALELRDEKLGKYIKTNLAEVKADTTQKQAVLENYQELKRKLIDDEELAIILNRILSLAKQVQNMDDDKGASSSAFSANPEDTELKLSAAFAEFVQNNLAEVKADTAQMKAVLDNIKKLKQTLIDEQKRAPNFSSKWIRLIVERNRNKANPEDKRLKLSAEFAEYVRNNLAEVKADTARMQEQLRVLKNLNRRLMADRKRGLKVRGMPNLIPSFKKMDSKIHERIRKLTELLNAKISLDDAYARHYINAKQITEEHLKTGCNQFTSMTDEDMIEFLAQMEKKVHENVARTTSIKAKLGQMNKEYSETYTETLFQIEQDLTEQLEKVKLEMPRPT